MPGGSHLPRGQRSRPVEALHRNKPGNVQEVSSNHREKTTFGQAIIFSGRKGAVFKAGFVRENPIRGAFGGSVRIKAVPFRGRERAVISTGQEALLPPAFSIQDFLEALFVFLFDRPFLFIGR